MASTQAALVQLLASGLLVVESWRARIGHVDSSHCMTSPQQRRRLPPDILIIHMHYTVTRPHEWAWHSSRLLVYIYTYIYCIYVDLARDLRFRFEKCFHSRPPRGLFIACGKDRSCLCPLGLLRQVSSTRDLRLLHLRAAPSSHLGLNPCEKCVALSILGAVRKEFHASPWIWTKMRKSSCAGVRQS